MLSTSTVPLGIYAIDLQPDVQLVARVLGVLGVPGEIG